MATRDSWTEASESSEMLEGSLSVERSAVPLHQQLAGTIAAPAQAFSPFPGVVIGTLLALDGSGTPLVCCAAAAGGEVLRARSVVGLQGGDVGLELALAFEGCDPRKPVVLGVLREGSNPLADGNPMVEASLDGQRMVISARERLVLRCGEASITLTRAGKVLICGNYVLSQSTGANRLKGGSIQLN